jgi:UDP-sulfoquinovose synthase
VELAIVNPARGGEYRVFNQFTETYSVSELAQLVLEQGRKLGLAVEVGHIENPRVELEEHHYNPKHTKLLDLGLEPHNLSDVLVDSMIKRIAEFKHRIKPNIILPRVRWNGAAAQVEELKLMWAGA